MARHLEAEIQEIQKRLMSIFGVVEQMIDNAAQALCDKKVELAAKVIETDAKVNQAEVEIEEECLKTLALHQPVATDLRRIVTTLKINDDLERMADLACNIAERAESMHQHPAFQPPMKLREMVKLVTKMIQMALDAFVNYDSKLAKQVILFDDSVDQYNLEIIHELRDVMQKHSNHVDAALHCFSAARQIERVADLAENIAEDVIYLVDGEIVRHKHDILKIKEERA